MDPAVLPPRPDSELRDAFERRREEAWALFEALFHAQPTGLALLDRDLRYVRVNEMLARVNGLPPEAHIGRNIAEVVPHLERLLSTLIRRVFATGEAVLNFEFSGEVLHDGTQLTVLANFHPLRLNGEVLGCAVAITDITEQRRTEEELRRAKDRIEELLAREKAARAAAEDARERFWALLEKVHVPICVWRGPELLLDFANAAFRTFVRRPVPLGESVARLFPEVLSDEIVEHVKKVRRERRPLSLPEVRVTFTLPDGSLGEAFFAMRIEPARSSLGRDDAVLCTYENVSDHVRARRQLAERSALAEQLSVERARLDAILEELPIGVMSVDAAPGSPVRMNEALLRIFGAGESQKTFAALPPRVSEVLNLDGTPVGPGGWPIARAMGGEVVRDEEFLVSNLGQEPRPVRVSANPVRGSDGRVIAAVATIADLRPQRRVEEELRASARRLADVLEGVSDAFFAMDREMRITFLNREAERIIEQPASELLGKAFFELFPEGLGTIVEREVRRSLDRREPSRFETFHKRLGKHYDVRLSPNPGGLSVSFADVSNRVRAARALADSEARFRSVIENSLVGIFFYGEEGRIDEANDSFLHLLGASAEAAAELGWSDIFRRGRAGAPVDGVFGGHGRRAPGELVLHSRSGEAIPVLVSTAPIDGVQGRSVAFVVNLREREELARRLEEERALLQAVMDQLPNGLIVADAPGGRVRIVNRGALELWGRPEPYPATLEGFAHFAAFRPDGTLHTPETMPLARSLRQGEQVSEEMGHELPDGTRLVLHVRSRPVRTHDGEIVAAAAVLEDITEQKRAEEERARHDAFRDLFIGILGHDLRNPLAAIITSATLMEKRGELTERDIRSARRIVTAGDRIARMITQLLDFTRSRLGGGIPILRQRTNLHAIVQRVADELQPTLTDRRIDLVLEGDGAGVWDPDRLGQVVSNLLGNAVEHGSRESTILVRADDHQGNARLSVSNHGAPIPPELLPVIFDPFRRVPGQKTGHHGLGLGLYIGQQIVIGHGGRIEVESTPDGRTTFTVTLPRGE